MSYSFGISRKHQPFPMVQPLEIFALAPSFLLERERSSQLQLALLVQKKQNSLFQDQRILPCRGWLYSVGSGTLVKNAARYPAFFGNHCLYSLLVLRNKKKYYLDVHRQMGLTSSRVLSSVEAVQKRFIVQIVNGEKEWQ